MRRDLQLRKVSGRKRVSQSLGGGCFWAKPVSRVLKSDHFFLYSLLPAASARPIAGYFLPLYLLVWTSAEFSPPSM